MAQWRRGLTFEDWDGAFGLCVVNPNAPIRRFRRLSVTLLTPELLRDVFGEETLSSHLVFGAASLPLGSPVELEVIFEVKPQSN
jgi:hypothetical protein